MRDRKIIKQLYDEYVKYERPRKIGFEWFFRRIKNWYTFWQICELQYGNESTRPRSVSWTYIWKKYTNAVSERNKLKEM